MARVRANFFEGTLSSEMTSGATALWSTALVDFPPVAGGDTAYLVVGGDDDTKEIVRVTSHAPGAPSAAVDRGQEGTTAGEWPAGTRLVQAPIASDLDLPNFDIRSYGAIGDGTRHSLSEQYATLADAQAVYPHAYDLRQTFDHMAIEAAFIAANEHWEDTGTRGVVSLPAGHFIVRRAGLNGGTYTTVVACKSGAIMRGAGVGSTIVELDPTGPESSTGCTVLRIGDETTGETDIDFEDFSLLCNRSVFGTGSIWGINGRHATATQVHCDRITVRRVYIEDTRIAVGCARSVNTGVAWDGSAGQLAARHQDWLIEDCHFHKTSNKVIEAGNAVRFTARDCLLTDVETGPQAILFSSDVRFERLRVRYANGGMRINHGVKNVTVLDCDVRPAEGGEALAEELNPDLVGLSMDPTDAEVYNSALIIDTEPRAHPLVDMADVTISNCTFVAPGYNADSAAMRWRNRPENIDVTIDRLKLKNNQFDGDLDLTCNISPDVVVIRDVSFEGCAVAGAVLTSDTATLDAEVRFEQGSIGAASTFAADAWELVGTRLAGNLTITGDSCRVELPPGPGNIIDTGSSNVVIAAVPDLPARVAATTTVTGTTSETDLATLTVPASTSLRAGDVLRVRAGGTFTNNTGGAIDVTFRVKLDGNTIATILPTTTVSASVNTRRWHIDVDINLASLSSQILTGFANLGTAAASSSGLSTSSYSGGISGTGTVDLSSLPKDIKITVQPSASGASTSLVAASVTHLKS